jgi:hypothetical protein
MKKRIDDASRSRRREEKYGKRRKVRLQLRAAVS